MQTEVTTWSREMLSPDQLRTQPCPLATVRVERADIPSPELSRFLYTAAGGLWYWYKRLDWDYARWVAYLDRPVVETLVMYVSGTPAGYIELEAQADDSVEIVYFGLFARLHRSASGRVSAQHRGAACLGPGCAADLGAHLQLDGPNALANYQARGFQVFDQTTTGRTCPRRRRAPGLVRVC